MADYSITGDTRLDASGFNKGISAMSVVAGNVISDLVKTATGKMASLATSSVQVGMSFQASMSQVAATMGTSTDQIQNLTDKALEMGSTTKFTATQAADALNYLALAGYDADKAAEVLPSVLSLAAAGGMDLAYASNLVTDAMASLNLEANKQNVDDFGNKLAMAASKANANVSQLGEAILTVGGTVANLKGGTTELTTALGLLANVGIKGAEGGTHLRNIILSLQSPTDDAAKLMQQLGLSVYDAQGNMRGLDEILGDLNASMAGMTQGQKDSIINQLFNKTDLAAVNGLLAAQGEQWDALAAQIDSASGAMDQMADTQQDNLQGVMTSLGSAFEGLQLALYNGLEPALTEAGNWGIQCIRALSASLTEGGPSAMLDAASSILADLAAGIVQQIPGLASSATQTITRLVEYLASHQGAIFDAATQVMQSLVQGLADNLPALITAAAGLIAQFAAALLAHLPDILDCGAQLLATLAQGIVRNLENLAEAALACAAKLLGVWDGSMDEWGHIGENLVAGLLNGISRAWGELVASVRGKVSGMVDTVRGVLGIHSPSKVFEEIGGLICAGLTQGIEKGAPYVENVMANFAQQTVANFSASLDDTWDEINDSLQTNTLGSIQKLASAIQSGDVAQLGQWAAALFWHACTQEQQAQIQTLAQDALNRLTASLQSVGSSLVNLATGLVGRFVPAAGAAATAQNLLNTALNANPILLVVSLLGLLSGALVTFGNTNNKVASKFAGVWRAVKNVISLIFEGILRAIGAAVEAVVVAINAIIWAHNKIPLLDDWDYVENPFWAKADQLAAQRKENDRADDEALKQYDTAAAKTDTKNVIASTTDTHKDTRADGSTVTTKVLTETLQDSAGNLTKQVTKTVTEEGKKLVNGVERAYKTVTTYVDGVQTKVEQTLDDITKTATATPEPAQPTTPQPDDSALKDNTAAILEANKKLAEMVKNANALVLTDNRVIGARVAASGSAQIAAAANSYHTQEGDNITMNIYSKTQTAADLMREARWEADRAKSRKR